MPKNRHEAQLSKSLVAETNERAFTRLGEFLRRWKVIRRTFHEDFLKKL